MHKTNVFLRLIVAMTLLAVWPARSDPGASAAGASSQTTQSTTFSYFSPAADAGGHGIPFLIVDLGNHLSATFVIDTGTSVCIVSDTLAAKLGVTPQPWMEDGERTTDVRGKPANFILMPSFKLGSMPIVDMPFMVLPEDYIQSVFSPFNGHSVDGILGMPFFQKFTTLFDFPNHRITLWSPAGLEDLQRRQLGFGDTGPVALSKSQSITAVYGTNILFSNGGKRSKEFLMFDTGAQITTAPPSLIHQLGLVAGPVSWNSTSHGIVGTREAQVDSLSIGQLRLTKQTLTFPSNDDGRLPVSLGMDVLSHYRVLLDLQRQQMYLNPGQATGIATGISLSGVQLDLVKLRNLVTPPPVSMTVTMHIFPPSELSTKIDNRPLSEQRTALWHDVQQHHSNAMGWQRLAEIDTHLGKDKNAVYDSSRAVALYRRLCQRHPKDAVLLAQLGDALRVAKKIDEAEAVLHRSVMRAPRNWLGWAVLGQIHSKKALTLLTNQKIASVSTTDISQFQHMLNRLQKHPPSPTALVFVAHLTKQAQEESGRAVALTPHNPLPYIRRDGNFTIRLVQNLLRALRGQYSDPLSILTDDNLSNDIHVVARLEPGSIAANAKVIFQDTVLRPFLTPTSDTQTTSEAMSKEAISVKKDIIAQAQRLQILTRSRDRQTAASAFSLLGFIQMMWLNELPKAEESFHNALALDAMQETAWQGLTAILAQQGKLSDVAALLRSKLQNPNDPDAALDHLFLARAEYKLSVLNKTEPGRDVEAQARIALRLAPNDLVTRLTVAALLLKASDQKPAILSQVGELLPPMPPPGTPPDLSTQYALTRSLYLALVGKPEQALPLVTTVLKADPDSEDAKNILSALQPASRPNP